MRPLQQWSFARVLLVSLAWVVLVVALTAGFGYREMWAATAGTGSGGIGAVSAGLPELILFLAVPSAPAILMIAWLVLRR